MNSPFAIATVIPFISAILGCSTPSDSGDKPAQFRIEIRDGSGVAAAEVLNAVWHLSATQTVEIKFEPKDRKPASVIALSREQVAEFPGDWMAIFLRENQIIVNDEIQTLDQLRERLEKYAETAQLVEAEPFAVVAADAGVDGSELVDVFAELAAVEITFIIPTRNENTANKPE